MVAKKTKTALKPSTVVYEEPWGDFTKGAPVTVSSPRTDGTRGHRWAFLRYARNVETGSEWVDVTDKNGVIRSFRLEQVTLIKPKRKYTRRKV